jgi:hypothetical protein
MKKYYVEFHRTSYLEIEVDAEDRGQAESLAWEELDKDPDQRGKDWEVHFIHKEEQ